MTNVPNSDIFSLGQHSVLLGVLASVLLGVLATGLANWLKE